MLGCRRTFWSAGWRTEPAHRDAGNPSSTKGRRDEPPWTGMPVGASVVGNSRESTAPGAASAARAGVWFSFAGRSAVFRRRRFGPALLRKAPKDAVAVSRRLRRPRRVFRHGPAASCSTTMASWLRCLNPHSRQSLPRCRDRLDRHDSPGFDQGLLLSRRAPRAFRRSREAAALPCSMPMPPVLTGRPTAHPVDSPPAPHRARGVSVPDAGASPRRLQNALASRMWHLGVGSRQLRPPRQRRTPTCCPVSRSDRNGSRPIAPGRPKTRSVYSRHQGGTSAACLSALPLLRSSAV